MGEINKLKSFRNDKKSYEDRKSHVNSVLTQVDVNKLVKNSLYNEYMMGNLEKSLEDLGTYLLSSSDVESERALKYSFYRNEKYYKTSTNIGRKTNIVDFEERDDIQFGEMNPEINDLKEEYIFRLFDPEKLTIKEKRNILKIGIPSICNIKNKYIVEEIDNFLSYYIEKTKNGKELLIFNYATKGMTDDEISIKINIPRRTVGDILNRIIK